MEKDSYQDNQILNDSVNSYYKYFPKNQQSNSKLKKQLKDSKKKKWWRGQKLKSKFKEFDIYGKSISLTYKGED